MNCLPDFDIKSNGVLSKEFLARDIGTFHKAIEWIRQLQYGRNVDKDDLKTVFADHKGTCSTKHALLKQLAEENHIAGIKLIMGVFKMNAHNTPKVAQTLAAYYLSYIPEAHIYLKYDECIYDFTHSTASPENFINDIFSEKEIQPNEISHRKVALHKNFLATWLVRHKEINYSTDEIWSIREQCIQDLSN